MKKIIKIKRRVAALVMSFFLTLGFITPAFNITAKAEAVEVANGACTIADMIFSYCASGGVAVMNTSVIDQVYNVLGSSFGTLQTFVDNGLLTYSNGQYVDNGLSTNISSAIENISSIDIGALFNQTSEQNPSGVALTGAASLAGIAGSVATTGVLPVVAGVAVTGYCGFQIGTIIANFLGLYGKPIGVGVGIDTSSDVLSKISNGDNVAYINADVYGNNIQRYWFGSGVTFSYKSGIDTYVGMYNANSSSITVRKLLYKNGTLTSNENETLGIGGTSSQSYGTFSNNKVNRYMCSNVFNSKSEFDSACAGWRNGTVTPNGTKSPDIVGSAGNVQGNYSNGQYSFPEVNPKIDPTSQSVNPSALGKDDWKDYSNTNKQNYENGDTEQNADVFNNILNRIVIGEPTPVPEPEPEPNPDPNPNPDPETVPVPSINPYPNTYPVADPETVPENKPQPEYTEKATENETDITEGDPYTTPDLLDKFPFCIPRDILRAFKKLDSGSREAPHIQWRFHPNEMIDYTFDVDFSTWENVAVLLRLLELIAFIVLLGVATRNLILS